MAWTNPIISWIKGQVVKASDMNAIGVNLNLLRTPPRGNYNTNYAYPGQTISTTFGQVASATVTVSDFSGKRALVTISGSLLAVGAGNAFGVVDVIIDGTRVGNASYGLQAYNSATLAGGEVWSAPFCIVYQTSVLSAGSHTIALGAQQLSAGIASYIYGRLELNVQEF